MSIVTSRNDDHPINVYVCKAPIGVRVTVVRTSKIVVTSGSDGNMSIESIELDFCCSLQGMIILAVSLGLFPTDPVDNVSVIWVAIGDNLLAIAPMGKLEIPPNNDGGELHGDWLVNSKVRIGGAQKLRVQA